jgi:hypothetical protein
VLATRRGQFSVAVLGVFVFVAVFGSLLAP